MGDFLVPLVALGTAVFLIVLGVGGFVLRRFMLTRSMGTFDCSMRNESAHHAAGAWMPGVARYEHDRLDWFRVFTMSPRPSRSLTRARLEILERRGPERAELHAVLPGWVVVRCAYGPLTLELAMSEPAYNGLATWLESGPPGQNVSIA